ncbi:MAG: hypothetical protein EB127_00090 [Alphaproteobacteria bacterium]|nr:hypothetical protein [Alphaproteobacteria bacterium]
MSVENKIAQALANITSQKDMEALFRKLAFEEYQAIMDQEDSGIEAESLETQEITLVTGCEVECTLESCIEEF